MPQQIGPYYGWNYGAARGEGFTVPGSPTGKGLVRVHQNMQLVPSSKTCTDPMLELGNLHQQFVKGVDFLTSQDINPEAPTYVKRPWIDEPSGAIPFDDQNGIALPAVGSVAVVLRTIVHEGYDGVIKYISNNLSFCGFTQFSGDVIWRILINGRPVNTLSNILNEKGTIEIPRPISPLRIYSRDIVEYQVFHAANAGLVGQTVCSLNGYFYPSKGVS